MPRRFGSRSCAVLATEDWLDARLAAGEGRYLVGDIEAIIEQTPLRERLWVLLMRALHDAGRSADVLRAYQRARSLLVNETGLDPGAELRAVEASIIAGTAIGSVSADVPATRYATTDDGLKIGYWVRGSGPTDVVFCAEVFFNLDLLVEFKELWAFLDPIVKGRRLIVVQRRSTGVSDRATGPLLPPPEACVADIDAVLDAVGTERTGLVGWGHGGQVALSAYTYDDMVLAQYRSLTEKLGVRHLRLLIGTSMGGMHSWLWAVTYPQFMDAVMPSSVCRCRSAVAIACNVFC